MDVLTCRCFGNQLFLLSRVVPICQTPLWRSKNFCNESQLKNTLPEPSLPLIWICLARSLLRRYSGFYFNESSLPRWTVLAFAIYGRERPKFGLKVQTGSLFAKWIAIFSVVFLFWKLHIAFLADDQFLEGVSWMSLETAAVFRRLSIKFWLSAESFSFCKRRIPIFLVFFNMCEGF